MPQSSKQTKTHYIVILHGDNGHVSDNGINNNHGVTVSANKDIDKQDKQDKHHEKVSKHIEDDNGGVKKKIK